MKRKDQIETHRSKLSTKPLKAAICIQLEFKIFVTLSLANKSWLRNLLVLKLQRLINMMAEVSS